MAGSLKWVNANIQKPMDADIYVSSHKLDMGDDRGSYRLIRKVFIRKCMQNKVTKYNRGFLKSLVNLRFIMMVLFKCNETKAKLKYYMTGPFVNMIK